MFKLPIFGKIKNQNKPVVLLIMDGFGVAPTSEGNAISLAKKPNYDYYLWIDGNITLTHRDAVKYFYEQCKDYDIVAFKHFRRPDIRQEYRYTRKGIKQTRLYLYNRYKNEILKGIKDEILSDKSYIDDYLLMGGVFMYKNTLKVQEMFKNWWYFNSRYIYQDQLSFPYVVKKAGLKINIIKDNMMKSPYLSFKHHRRKK